MEATICGLVGVIGDLFVKDVDRFKWLLSANRIRGPYATGISSIVDGQVRIAKVDDVPEYILEDKDLSKFFNTTTPFLMGHNRWPTKGSRDSDAAHPYLKGHIVGAHNGTIQDHPLDAIDKHLVGVTDSEKLFDAISKYGVEDTMKHMFGAWALTWYDKKQKTFNLLRNKERPLYYVVSKYGTQMAYASEPKMLDWCLTRKDSANDTPWEYNDKGIVELQPGTLISIPLEKVNFSNPLQLNEQKIEQEVSRYVNRPFVPQGAKLTKAERKAAKKALTVIDGGKTQTSGGTASIAKTIEVLPSVSHIEQLAQRQAVAPSPEREQNFRKKYARATYDELVEERLILLNTIKNLELGRGRMYEEISGIAWYEHKDWVEAHAKSMFGKISSIDGFENCIEENYNRVSMIKVELDFRDGQIALEKKTKADQAKRLEAQQSLQKKINNPEFSGAQRLDLMDAMNKHFKTFHEAGLWVKGDIQHKIDVHKSCAVCPSSTPAEFDVDTSIVLPNNQGIVCSNCADEPGTQEYLLCQYGFGS